MQERRELPRWRIGKQAKVVLNSAQDPRDGYIEDMNLKSMRVSLPEPLPQDHPVRLTITLTDDFDLNVEVQVRWVKEEIQRYVHGLSFSFIMDGDKDKIYQFVSRNCFKQFKDNWWA